MVLEDKIDQELRNLGPRAFTNFLWPWAGHLSSLHLGFISLDMYGNIYPLNYLKLDKIYESILKITECSITI